MKYIAKIKNPKVPIKIQLGKTVSMLKLTSLQMAHDVIIAKIGFIKILLKHIGNALILRN